MFALRKIMLAGLAVWTALAATAFAAALPTTRPTPENTVRPVPTPECRQSGTKKIDRVLFLDDGDDHGLTVYLPPCYSEQRSPAYPVLYWTASFGQDVFSVADQLIARGDTPAFIMVMIDIDSDKGSGADAQIVNYVVPYIDSHYHTQPDRLHRSITGISHGAAIAARAAFRPPGAFGRVALLSGGIAEVEQGKFTGWIQAMSPDQRPAVLIDVGDQDGILVLAQHLMDILDKLDYPFMFTHAPGGHTSGYWTSHMPEHLIWLMAAH